MFMKGLRHLLLALACSNLFLPAAGFAEVTLYTDNQVTRNVLVNSDLPSGSLISDSYRYVLSHLNRFPDLYFQNQIRAEKLLTPDTAACQIMKVRTEEREKHYLFSEATDVYLSHKLYVQQEYAATIRDNYLNNEGEVASVSAIFQDAKDRVLLLITGHSYGQYLDAEITHIDNSQRYYLGASDPYDLYFKMFNQERGQFALLIPSALKNSDTPLQHYTSFALANNPPYITGHIMCSKHPESAQFIKDVNAVLYEYYRSGTFEKYAMRYFPDEELGTLRHFIHAQVQRLQPGN